MRDMLFGRRLLIFYLLVRFQRIIRLLLRATWLGAAGYLLAQTADTVWGVLPDSSHWLLVAIGFSSLALLGILIPWPRRERFAWQLDRTFSLQEQVSTAYQVSQVETRNEIGQELLADASTLLPEVRNRVLKRGWFLLRDVVSCLILALLFWLIYLGHQPPVRLEMLPSQPMQLQPLGQDPTAEQIFPSGMPALELAEPADSAPPEPDGDDDLAEAGESSGGSGSGSGPGPADDILRQLGEALGDQAVTYDVGNALQRGNLSEAANALESLADQLAQLSEDTKEKLAQAFAEAAEQLAEIQQPEAQSLSQTLQTAVEALQEDDDLLARDMVDQIATDLRQMAQPAGDAVADINEQTGADWNDTFARPGGSVMAETRERSAAQPIFQRLDGEGSALALGQESDQSGVLSPGRPEGVGDSMTASAYDQLLTGDDSVVQTVLTPHTFHWTWRDVVSNYFSPR